MQEHKHHKPSHVLYIAGFVIALGGLVFGSVLLAKTNSIRTSSDTLGAQVVNVGASIPQNPVNTKLAQLTEFEQQLNEREALLDAETSRNVTQQRWFLIVLLFLIILVIVLFVLLMINFRLDHKHYRKMRRMMRRLEHADEPHTTNF